MLGIQVTGILIPPEVVSPSHATSHSPSCKRILVFVAVYRGRTAEAPWCWMPSKNDGKSDQGNHINYALYYALIAHGAAFVLLCQTYSRPYIDSSARELLRTDIGSRLSRCSTLSTGTESEPLQDVDAAAWRKHCTIWWLQSRCQSVQSQRSLLQRSRRQDTLRNIYYPGSLDRSFAHVCAG